MRLRRFFVLCIFLAYFLLPAAANADWTYPNSLDDSISPNGSDADYPLAAISDNGDAIVIWYQDDSGGDMRLFLSQRVSGTWTNPSDIDDYVSFDASDLNSYDLAMDDNGNAVIIWEQDGRIFKAEYRNGSWTWPSDYNDYINPLGTDVESFSLAMDSHGNVIIAWEQLDGGDDSRVYKSEKRAGTWTHPSDIDDYISPAAAPAGMPSAAMSDNGNAIIAWIGVDSSDNTQTYKAEYLNGSWSYPIGIDDYISLPGVDAEHPKAAMDPQGNAIIAWIQEWDSAMLVYTSHYSEETNTWTHPTSSADAISDDDCVAVSLALAMNSDGEATVTWQDFLTIYASTYQNSTWATPQALSSLYSIATLGNVDMDGDGNAVVTWYILASTLRTQKAEFRDNSWSIPASEDDYFSFDATDAWLPFVALADSGEGLLLWGQEDLSAYAQIYKGELGTPAVPGAGPRALLLLLAGLGLAGVLLKRGPVIRLPARDNR